MYFTCTHHPAGALPLQMYVWITSVQSQHVIRQCLEKVQNMLAPHAFGGSGPKTGPDIFMTDDDFEQRGALLDTWKEVIILLCTFHFLQTIWHWLYNSSNNINRDDHQQLMGHFQKLVRTPPSRSRIYITMQLIWLLQNIPIVTKSMKKDL